MVVELVQAKVGVAQMNVLLYQPMRNLFVLRIPIADIQQHATVVRPVVQGKSIKETQFHVMVAAR